MRSLAHETLGPLIEDVLAIVTESPILRGQFYFTGGTALSGLHLHHRMSADLDFATDYGTAHEAAIRAAVMDLCARLRCAGYEAEPATAPGGMFAQVFVRSGAMQIKIDLAAESPFKLAPPDHYDPLDLAVYSLRDMAAHKLGALVGRMEPRDYVDVYFLRRVMDPARMIEDAVAKDPGLDAYVIAVAFKAAEHLHAADLPVMTVPLDLDDLKRVFGAWAARLIRGPS